LSHGVTRPPAIVQSVLFQGKVFDKSDMMGSLKPTPKMRPKAASRPRPKTIHIDSGSVEMAEGMMQPSRGKKGSTSNLTANSTMKRDYYRGSQDSLADRSMSSGMLYRGVFLFYFVFIFFYLCGDCLEILVVTIGAGPFLPELHAFLQIVLFAPSKNVNQSAVETL
jgi:hypothetical protein